jgi:hypothetical protein
MEKIDREDANKQINKIYDKIGEVYCRIREARGILEILDERWGYIDPPIDVQYAYLGTKSILKAGEDLIDGLEGDVRTFYKSVEELFPEPEYFFDGDDEQTPEWDDDAQMDLPIQDEEGNTIIINASHADDDYWTSQDSR